jgi:hypothetical protein
MSFITFVFGLILGFVISSLIWSKQPESLTKFINWLHSIFSKKGCC